MHPKLEDIWAAKDKLKSHHLSQFWLAKITRLCLHNLLALTDFGRCLSISIKSVVFFSDDWQKKRTDSAKLFWQSQSWRKRQKISIVKSELRQNSWDNALKNTKISAKIPFDGWQLLFEDCLPEKTSLYISWNWLGNGISVFWRRNFT